MCHPAVTRVWDFKVQFGWHSSHSVSVESCLRCSETGCTTWLLQPARQPALHLLNLIRTMNTHVIMLCSNVHYLHLANCEGHDFLFSVQNELGTAGRAVRAVWRLPHWRRPDFLVPFVAVHVLDLHFATSRLMGWLRKDTLPSHVICSSILRFAVCHGCKQSVVPRRLLVMWCEKQWHITELCPSRAHDYYCHHVWSEQVEGLGWYKSDRVAVFSTPSPWVVSSKSLLMPWTGGSLMLNTSLTW